MKELLATYGESESDSLNRFDDVLQFVQAQMDRMPWFPRYAIKLMTLLFGVTWFVHNTFPFFGRAPKNQCKQQLRAWSHSSWRPCRDLVKFYAAMVVLSLYSDTRARDSEGV